MPPHDTRKTADAYWNAGPQAPLTGAARDPHGLGEPPRALTPPLQRYCKRATPSLFVAWVILAVLFSLGHVMTMIIAPEARVLVPFVPILFIALSVWSGRRLSALRKRIRFVLMQGQFTEATVRDLRVVEKRYGRRVVYEYHVDFDLGHRTVVLVTRDPGASLLQVGLRDSVLWHESEPDVVVPTFLVAG